MAAEGYELAKAYVQIIPSARGMEGQIAREVEPEAAKAGKDSGESFGKNLIAKVKAIVKDSGIGKVLKQSLFEGAALEQSIGGIETLFGDSADKMREYASQAYKTAGVSANTYMEQATGFAASLLSSLGNDTDAAAEAANTAIMDMADNANKMGTSLDSIQNAYSGFAKQNYTMLDNLKLGYGGTKSEMERLLKDAQALTGVKYDINSLADVYAAVHAIQEDLGITGTTAKEAASTFSGSMGSMKAALSDFLGNLMLGENVESSFAALVDTASVFFFDNLMPAIGRIVVAIPGVLGSAITEHLPKLLDSGLGLLNSIADGFSSGVPAFMDSIPDMILQLATAIIEYFPQLVDVGLDLLDALATGFIDGIPDLLNAVVLAVQNLLTAIAQHFPEIVARGMELIVNLAKGAGDAIPQVVHAIGEIIKAVFSAFRSVDWFSLGKDIILGIKEGILAMASGIADAVKGVVSAAKEKAKNALGIHSPSTVFRDEVGQMMGLGIAEGIEDSQKAVRNALKDVQKTAVASIDVDSAVQTASTIVPSEGQFNDEAIISTILSGISTIVAEMRAKPVATINGMSDTDVVRAYNRGVTLAGYSLAEV